MKAPLCVSSSGATPANESLSRTPARLRRATACALTILLLCNAALGASAAKAAKKPAPKAAKVTEAKPSAVKSVDGGRVSFKLTVKGEGFGTSPEAVSLALLNEDGEDAVASDETAIESVEPTKIVAQVVASHGPYSLRLKIGKTAADTAALGPVTTKLTKTSKGGSPSPIEIEAPEVSAYTSEGTLKKYALVVKRKDGNFFETDARLVSLSLTPAGAADVTIRRVTPTRVEADFWAPDGYKVRDIGVTIYDRDDPQTVVASSDVSKDDEEGADGAAAMMMASASSGQKPKSSAKPEDAQPEITSTSIIFLQRAYGIGRLKIEGKNFGIYEAPPVSAENYLLCFEPLARQALVRALEEGGHPNGAGQQKLEDQRCAYLGKSADDWQAWRAKVEPLVKVALVPRNTDLRIEQTKVLYIDDKLIDVYFEFNRYYRNSEPMRLASATVTVKKAAPSQTAAPKQQTTGDEQTASAHGPGFVNAMMGATAGDKAKPPTAATPELKTYIASRDIESSQKLEYTYDVLDNESAKTLFGAGVATNFYAIQLSVTNMGDKKVAIPRSTIKVEAEWAYGPSESKDPKQAASVKQKDPCPEANPGATLKSVEATAFADTTKPDKTNAVKIPCTPRATNDYYEEGPVTLSPLSLQTVAAFFDGNEKVKGPKAKMFNIFEGAAIATTSLFPFLGQGFRDAHGAFTGSVVPGIRRGIGDLSGQQLQNLTGMSWQDVEVVGMGDSVVKYVFIQRRDSVFSPGFDETVRKTIKNIEGMEVKGIEVTEGSAKTAAHTGQQ
jgi:hypothetical protein